jgi:hypothetical protein
MIIIFIDAVRGKGSSTEPTGAGRTRSVLLVGKREMSLPFYRRGCPVLARAKSV